MDRMNWYNRLISNCLIVVSVIFFSSSVYAQDIFKVKDQTLEFRFSYSYISVLEDSSNTLTFQDILKKENNSRFIINNQKQYPSNDNHPNTYWLKIKIKPNSTSEKSWLLEFFDQTIDDLTAYIPNSQGKYDSLHTGDQQVFSKRTYNHKNFIFHYDNEGDSVQTLYFRVRSHELNNLIIVFRSYDYFIGYALTEYIFFGLIFGMVIIIFLFNFLTYFAIKKIQYLYYGFYIAFVGLYEASQTGLAYHFIWPNSPKWNQVAFGISLYIVIVMALMFTKLFLGLKKEAPFLNKMLNYAIIVRSVWFLFVIFFNQELFEYREIEIIPLFLAFYAGIHTYRNKLKHARYFVGAYGLLFVGFLVKTLVNLDIIPFSFLSHYSITLAFMGEMLFLSLALGDKIKFIGYQRDKAKMEMIKTMKEKELLSEKVNRELEQKVNERTLELNEANEKLIQQAHQITQFNLQLDAQNRILKKDVLSTTNKRIMNKLVDFEEFKQVFPDRITCYRYLDDLKSKRQFCCDKCSNDKYFENIKKFSRRCTRCGYNESITSSTIFKGIKFPIEKAFYIVYLVIINEEELTIEKLSQLLDLRPNTCWNFKDKVKKYFAENKVNRKNFDSYEGWDFLLT